VIDPRRIGWPNRKCHQPSWLNDVGSENASKGVFTEAKLSTLCGSRVSKDRWYVVVTSLVDTLKYDREYKRVGEVKGTGDWTDLWTYPLPSSLCFSLLGGNTERTRRRRPKGEGSAR
jgi:hypothetical protein